MILVNFAHPITQAQRQQVEALAGRPVERVVDVPTHFDQDRPFPDQVAELVTAVGLSAEAWQTLPVVVNLPAFAPIAALVLARLHGLIGHFPTVLRLRPVQAVVPTVYEVAEMVDLQAARAEARAMR
jgi:hypothetical protein